MHTESTAHHPFVLSRSHMQTVMMEAVQFDRKDKNTENKRKSTIPNKIDRSIPSVFMLFYILQSVVGNVSIVPRCLRLVTTTTTTTKQTNIGEISKRRKCKNRTFFVFVAYFSFTFRRVHVSLPYICRRQLRRRPRRRRRRHRVQMKCIVYVYCCPMCVSTRCCALSANCIEWRQQLSIWILLEINWTCACATRIQNRNSQTHKSKINCFIFEFINIVWWRTLCEMDSKWAMRRCATIIAREMK